MSVTHPLLSWLETSMPADVSAFLPGRRWFAGKARRIESVGLDDAVVVDGSQDACVLVIAGVRYTDGGQERYVMLTALSGTGADLPTIGAGQRGPRRTRVVEALTDPGAVRSLMRGFVAPAALPSVKGGTLRYVDGGAEIARVLSAGDTPVDIASVGAEQSNTSLRVGSNLVFKVFRKLDEGENPEVEMGRFLSNHTRFRATPRLQGSLIYTSPGGAASSIGVLQEWVDNSGDGWRYVVEQLRVGAGARAPSGPLLTELRGLGGTTADFHAALTSDSDVAAFTPEPVTRSDVEQWRTALERRAAHMARLAQHFLGSWPEETRWLGQAVVGRLRDRSLPRTPDMDASSAQFQKIRVHGDYHLGQTLRTANGFVLIDLEGEPGRPLDERRLKHCALKDVAGMIRSLDYAVETVRREFPSLPGDGTRASLRAAFLDGYLASASARQAVHLPAAPDAVSAWVDFFEVEKALYELEYEINNRPDWVHIPLRGILRILEPRR